MSHSLSTVLLYFPQTFMHLMDCPERDVRGGEEINGVFMKSGTTVGWETKRRRLTRLSAHPHLLTNHKTFTLDVAAPD